MITNSNSTIIERRELGRVSFNDGDFAELEISGTEGVEEGIFLETIQVSRDDTGQTVQDFLRSFIVGTEFNVRRIVQIIPRREPGEWRGAIVQFRSPHL